MITFVWLKMGLSVFLPLIVYYIFPPAKRRTVALRVPFYRGVEKLTENAYRRPVFHLRNCPFFLLTAWFFLVIAAMRPQWVGDAISLPQKGRDILLAIDLSGSMQIKDFHWNQKPSDRLTVAKAIASDFIERREGDRVGLVFFGTKAYLQSPLTFDRKTIQNFLQEAQIGFAGEKTAIGDGIILGLKHLEKLNTDKVLIVLTDGANTAGHVPPEKAAELASQKGVKIYTIGMGADEMQVKMLWGTERFNPSADLDEKLLRTIADQTQGKYFRARDTEGLKAIYHEIDKLEPVERELKYYRPQKELFYWPLSVAIFCVVIFLLKENIRRRRI